MKRGTKKEDEPISREEIARRAYELFERRGRVPGRDIKDWLEAEEQLRRERKARRKKQPQA